MEGLLINLIIIAIIAGLLIYVARVLPLPEPWPVVVQVLIVLLVVIWLLRVVVVTT
jgi:hypothetical protein